jgi:hyperosmotically inducible periplasmic protein
MKRVMPVMTLLALFTIACSTQRVDNASYKDTVQKSLEQADLKDVTVTEDRDKNVVTLGGTLHSEEAKARAAEVAKQSAGPRIVANEISVRPVGMETEARRIDDHLDDAIDSRYKAALISRRLDKSVRYEVKNGVLTLKGNVKTPREREEAQELAANTPDVQQVVNEITINR